MEDMADDNNEAQGRDLGGIWSLGSVDACVGQSDEIPRDAPMSVGSRYACLEGPSDTQEVFGICAVESSTSPQSPPALGRMGAIE